MAKPWGTADLRPWNAHHDETTSRIGEVWFQRPEASAPDSTLLLKLLYTREPLSIQVHPDDACARAAGLPHGKSEAWYILDAARDARVALGLKREFSAAQLRASIDDGSIEDLVQWRRVGRDDVISVPAGTIHAVGAGLVAMEVQQRSDTTYRLFDFGRGREIHADAAIAAARSGPGGPQPLPRALSLRRTLLLASVQFVLERIELPADSSWEVDAPQEMWIFILDGHASIGDHTTRIGDVMFVEADQARICVGPGGLKALAAYVGAEPIPALLRSLDRMKPMSALRDIPVEAAR